MQYSVNKRFSEEDSIASRWLHSFVYNSLTDKLRSATEKKYSKLLKNQRGGVIYTYYTLASMFTMSRDIKQAMLNYLDFSRTQDLAKVVRNENVLQAEAEVVGVCKRLNAAGALHEDVIIDILTGLSISSVCKFCKMFDTMLQNTKFGNYSLLNGIMAYSLTLKIIETIFAQATDYYDKINHSNKWNVANKGGGASGGGRRAVAHSFHSCWNCEQDDCNLCICKKPKDQNCIAKNKMQYLDSKEDTGGKRGGYRGDRNRGQDPPKGEEMSIPEYQRKKWEKQGMHLVNGQLLLNCKSCGMKTDSWFPRPSYMGQGS